MGFTIGEAGKISTENIQFIGGILPTSL